MALRLVAPAQVMAGQGQQREFKTPALR
jgi:hypothetical protein